MSHPARELCSRSLAKQQESKVQHPLQQGPEDPSTLTCAPNTRRRHGKGWFVFYKRHYILSKIANPTR